MLVVAWRRRGRAGERVVEVVVLAGAFAAGSDVVHLVAGLLLGGIFVDVALAWVLGVGSSVTEAGAVWVGVCLGGLGHFCLGVVLFEGPGYGLESLESFEVFLSIVTLARCGERAERFPRLEVLYLSPGTDEVLVSLLVKHMEPRKLLKAFRYKSYLRLKIFYVNRDTWLHIFTPCLYAIMIRL